MDEYEEEVSKYDHLTKESREKCWKYLEERVIPKIKRKYRYGDGLLRYAAYTGDVELCRYARKREGATCYQEMAFDAIRGGHSKLYHKAEKWGNFYKPYIYPYGLAWGNQIKSLKKGRWGFVLYHDHVLLIGAYRGHEQVCEIAKEFEAKDFEGMLYAASVGGRENTARLAIKWGAKNFERMMNAGAENGHRNICELAREMGVRNYTGMFHSAGQYGHIDLCYLANKWGIPTFVWMEYIEAYERNSEEKGTKPYNTVDWIEELFDANNFDFDE